MKEAGEIVHRQEGKKCEKQVVRVAGGKLNIRFPKIFSSKDFEVSSPDKSVRSVM